MTSRAGSTQLKRLIWIAVIVLMALIALAGAVETIIVLDALHN
jgi:hypothetical protein